MSHPGEETLARIDELCDRFEAAWKAGGAPSLAGLLCEVAPAEQGLLFRELYRLEAHYRRQRGMAPRAKEYAAAFPQHAEWLAAQRGAQGLPRVPGFEVTELLGRGAMGEVYKAFDPGLGRWVALKRVRVEQTAPEALARFRREAEALARLAHPHIVKVHGYKEHQGQPILEMEHVPGGTLEERLGRWEVAAEEAARLVAVLAWAVHAAHEKGIVHRDLKPSNVLMGEPVPGDSTNALGGYPKVSDFGLAAVRDAAGGHTLPDAVLGTPEYMAPEQAAGRSREVGPASDVWALGVILYRCLAGASPFKGDSVLDTLERVKAMQMRPLREALPEVPAELDAVVGACLKKEPGGRPTARELAERLERFTGGEVRPASVSDRKEEPSQALQAPRGPASRHRALALRAAAAAVVAGVVVALAWTALKRAPLDHATLRVKHYARDQGKDKHAGVIGAHSQGASYDDRVVVEVEAKRPAYFYLIGFNFDGKEQLLWPRPGEAPPALKDLTCPPPDQTGALQALRLDDHKGGGIQAYVLVASTKPLPPYAEWAGKRGERPWKRLPPAEGVWRSDGLTLARVEKVDFRALRDEAHLGRHTWGEWEWIRPSDGRWVQRRVPSSSVVPLEKEPQHPPPLLELARWAKGEDIDVVEAVAFPVYGRGGK